MMQPNFNPIGLDQGYGTVDKYFKDVLASLGYTGNVMGANQDFFGVSPEDSGMASATGIDPAFAAWAAQNGITTDLFQGDDYNIMRLLQGGNEVAQQRYTTQNGLDKFMDVAIPAAVALGTGGVFGQALGFVPGGMNPLDPSTWGGNALQGIPAQAGDFGAVAGGGGSTAGGSLLGGAMPEVGAGISGAGGFGGAAGGAAGGGMASLIPGLSNSTLFSVGGNLLSGLLQSNSAGKASDALTAAGREANALQKYMYDQTRADYAPYREAGTTALGQIQNLLSNPSAIMQQPDYQFGLSQGINARDQSAAQNGMLYSGAQQKALTQYGNDYAGSKLNESYNRLAGIAGIGQQATGSTTQAGMNYGNQVGNTLQGMGNARASGYVGKGNAWGNAFGNMLNDYQQNNVFKQFGFGD